MCMDNFFCSSACRNAYLESNRVFESDQEEEEAQVEVTPPTSSNDLSEPTAELPSPLRVAQVPVTASSGEGREDQVLPIAGFINSLASTFGGDPSASPANKPVDPASGSPLSVLDFHF